MNEAEKRIHDLELARNRNAKYRAKLTPEKKKEKLLRDYERIKKKKKDMLKELNVELLPKGKRMCPICLRVKLLSEYSFGKSAHKKVRNGNCDSCLTMIYRNTHRMQTDFSPAYWRYRAYACNATFRARLKRLGKYTGIQTLPYKVSGADLIRVFDRQKEKCVYCGLPLKIGNFQIDHRVPCAKGGRHTPDNLQFLCDFCNQLKQDMLEPEFKKAQLEYAKRIIHFVESRDKEPGR